jgi:isoleucyl-tRNA synthetase
MMVSKLKMMDETTVLSVSDTSNSELLTEQVILKEWEEADVYLQLLERAGAEQYVIQEMPSAIDGFNLDTFKCKIHQDVFLKFHIMQGEGVTYAPSWNYYTAAVERYVLNEVAKEVPKDALEFRKQCRRHFQQQLESRQRQFHALGIFGDWAATGKNLDTRHEWRLINAFNKLRNLGYLNNDAKLGYWCQECNTSLGTDGIEIRSAQVYSAYVKFPVSDGFEELGANIHIGVWVEDLWHLAGSIALGIKKDSQCLIVEFEGDVIICAEEDFKNYVSETHREHSPIIRKIKADELINYTCLHPFLGTELSIIEVPDLSEDSDDLLDVTDGRRADLLQLAPGHQPRDYRIAQALNLPIRSVVDDAGRLTEDADLFCGLNTTEAGQFIALELEKRGYLICGGVGKLQHPHCWTCDNQVLFRPVQQWIFALDNNQLRHRLLHSDRFWANYNEKNTEWMKQTIQNLPNLSVSCYRGWSSPLPIFQCEKCGDRLSDKRALKTVRDITSRRGIDVWFKLSVDELLPSDTVCPNCESKEFQKESALLDGRFATLLYAINRSDVKRTHIKHINVAFFSDEQFPRWFAQLALTALALHDTPPFKYLELIQVNSPAHPVETDVDWMAGYPADVLRILGIHPDFDSPSMNDLIEACEQEYNEIRARLCTILDELADFEPSEHRIPLDVLLPLDALALSATNQILQSVDLAYQGARFYEAWRVLIDFCKSHFESLYLPLLKERFKTAAEGYEKRSGQTVLWEILRLFVQRFAPIIPFLCEQIHERMRHDWGAELPPEHLTESDGQYASDSSQHSEAVDFSSIFLEDWIAQVDMPHIADVDAQWAELSKSVGGS